MIIGIGFAAVCLRLVAVFDACRALVVPRLVVSPRVFGSPLDCFVGVLLLAP
jgi:hypothetical protein